MQSMALPNQPYILLTNDDGVNAPGIKHLWKFLSSLMPVVVVAPMLEQSATGLSITIRRPLHIERVHWAFAEEAEVWAVHGTPADCVKLALSVILKSPPRFVLSGINRGGNAGRNILYSGTIAAVIEGMMHDIPGMALSAADFKETHYESVEPFLPQLLQYMQEKALPPGTFLNVNFPSRIHGGVKGMRLAVQGREFWLEDPEEREHPAEGNRYYWLGAKLARFDEHQESDIALLREGWATCVPIHITDLTHHHYVANQKDAFNRYFANDLGTESAQSLQSAEASLRVHSAV